MKDAIVNLMPGFLVRLFAAPYVSGNSIEKGIAKADELWNNHGISSTLDLLGEAVSNRAGVEGNVKIYIDLIKQLGGRDYTTVSIKPSALGSHESYEYCIENTRTLLEMAKEMNIEITIDMEDHTLTDLTKKLYLELLSDYPSLGTVLQSRLYRTPKDINDIIDLHTRIRMCIGIYNEDADIAFTDKQKMKEELFEHSKRLLKSGHFVEYATHDKVFIDLMLSWVKENNIPHDCLEFQQLMGVPMLRKQKEILDAGYVVRYYVPFATNWDSAIPYLKRRMINNPRMIFYVMKNIFTRN